MPRITVAILRLLDILFDRRTARRTGLAMVLVAAALFRFDALDWDGGRGFHPDERFLTMVSNDLTWPDRFENYFDPRVSTLSPYSLPRVGLYVYGMLPVYVVKGTAALLGRDDYDGLRVVGRVLSGVFDIASIALMFLIGRRLYGEKVGLLASALLSLTALNIQLSHFYAVDTFANVFVVATMYYVLRSSAGGRWTDYALTGLMFGLGLSSKISVVTLAVPILIGAALDAHRRARESVARGLEHTVVRLLTVAVVAAVTFRLLQPFAFAGPTFWDWSLNPRWQRDIAEQARILAGEADLPWMQQWTGRPATFALYNLVVWGMGLPLGVASCAGLAVATYELVWRRERRHVLPVVYILGTFAYHAAMFVKFMRYFLPIYPFLALLAAYLVARLWRRARVSRAFPEAVPGFATVGSGRPRWPRPAGSLPALAVGVAAVTVGGTLLYALAFAAIYHRPHTRIAASRWMYRTIPPGSVIANEHWDDWLPASGVDGKTAYGDRGLFEAVELPNYEDDTPDKLHRLVEKLAKADYVVLSSSRLSDSIPRLPMRYPMTSRYYELLSSGRLGFRRVAEFTSYPTILGFALRDRSAEESFSVYDHPRVQIFQKSAAFSPETARELLGRGIEWDSVVRLTPRQATAAPTALRLSPADRRLYQEVAMWSSGHVTEHSWGSRVPVLAWALALQAIGVLALPITLRACRRLADGGYVFAKAIGLLLTAWGAWAIASVRIAPFTRWTVMAVLALVALASLWVLAAAWRDLSTFVRARWRLLLVEEGLFWGCFAAALAIRVLNPDLWHPGLGGEKPMDLAYLTAVVRTPYFPAYDPWFAGGYINYYYFGFVLVATLIHLTGVVPHVAYNLAVPMLFAMTATGGFAVALNLAEGWRRRRGAEVAWLGVGRAAILAGACGALFVAVIGNLGQLQLLWNSLRGLSAIAAGPGASALTKLAQGFDGLARWLGGHALEFRTEWWYWNATRLIPPGPHEAGPINEMPVFTFLFADLHAHMMALPYTLVVLGLALTFVREPAGGGDDERARPRWQNGGQALTFGLLALTIGALWPMNTWDFPTYTVIVAAALACREYGRGCRVAAATLWVVTSRTAVILVAGRLLFLPFHQAYASANLGVEPWTGSQTPLASYVLIHGFFLFVIVSYLVTELLGGRGHNALVRSLRLAVRRWRRRRRMRRLFERVVRPTPGYRLAVRASGMVVVLVTVVVLIRPVVGVALGLIVLAGLLASSARPDPRRQFALCLIGLGLALTMLVETVVVTGDIGRMNTVFKFYLQVWVIWAVAGAAIVPTFARWTAGAPTAAAVRSSAGTALRRDIPPPAGQRSRAGVPAPKGWWVAFLALLTASLVYPLTAVPARIGDRFKDSEVATLDGTTYMRSAVYHDQGHPVRLEWDRQAVGWLRENARGLPTIVEAVTPLYRWGGRVSVYTGLPTVIGWDWHQKQQRAILPGDVIDRRRDDVRAIFTGSEPGATRRLLDRYGVRYIYVGPLERIYYGDAGLRKFDLYDGRLWDLVYQNEEVKIYAVRANAPR